MKTWLNVMSLSTALRIRPAVSGYPAGSTIGPRVLEDFQFIWLLTGKARYRWYDAGVEFGLEPGALLLVRPEMRHKLTWDPRTACHFGITGFQITPAPDTGGWPLLRPIATPGPIGGLLDYLLWLAGEPDPSWLQAAEETIATLLRIFVWGPLPGAQDYHPVEPQALADALDHIRREWTDEGMRPVPTAELSSAAGVSREHLTRLFHAQYGLSLATALGKVRLARAAAMLLRTNLTISEIAHTCGYADPLHFSRRFRTNYGNSPRAYRESGAETPLATPSLRQLAYRLTLDRLPPS